MSETLLQTPPLHRGPDELASRLYAEYGDRIFRYCYGRLRSREEAEDAVQNTFLRVCTALRKGVVPEFEAPWLYKIAHNVCLSRRLGSSRRARVETPADLETLGERAAARIPDADELFGLEDALADMPANLRAPLLLREWQGLSYAEIAGSLGVSHSAVETLIFRARRHLAKALTDSVKKGSRAIASIFNLRWAFDWIRGLAAGAGSAGLAAGAAGLAVVIGGGVAFTVTGQSGPSAAPASSVHVARVSAARAAASSGMASHRPAAAARSASTSATAHGGRAAKAMHAPGGHSGGSGSSSATAPGAPAVASAPSSSAAAAASAGTKAKPAATSQQPPAGHREQRPPADPSSGSAPSGPVPPVIPPVQVPALPSVPAVPDPSSVLPPASVPVPPLPDPPAVDPPPLPPPPVSLPPVPPAPPLSPLPPVPPAPPLPPVPPLVPGGLLP
jgi:RNA polymerase sigma factor (sigma-70 family)